MVVIDENDIVDETDEMVVIEKHLDEVLGIEMLEIEGMDGIEEVNEVLEQDEVHETIEQVDVYVCVRYMLKNVEVVNLYY